MSFILKPGKNSAWLKRELKNLLTSVILHGKIETSSSLAKNNKKSNLTKLLAKFVGLAKKANKEPEKKQCFYRSALRLVKIPKKNNKNKQKEKKILSLSKSFDDLGKKYQNRSGGYSRVIKLGSRNGDNSLRVIFALC